MLNLVKISRRLTLAGAAVAVVGFGLLSDSPANAENGKRICVSWRHFQEERWRIDEAGIKSVLGPAGYTYVSADAQGDPQKQMTDVDSLLDVEVRRGDHPRPGFERDHAGNRAGESGQCSHHRV